MQPWDQLESRRLMAGVTASLTSGVLTINGTDESDVISVNYNTSYTFATKGKPVVISTKLLVQSGDQVVGTFKAEDVTKLKIYGKAGRDKITFSPSSLTSIVQQAGSSSSIITGIMF